MNVEVRFGALAPSLAQQLDRKPSDVELWQRDADAITRLRLRGLISERVARDARKRLLSVIAGHMA